ncbi:MAG: enoyl-CoA hydratase/isomerase family protein [Alphaproteobacteria bacterium]|nr:enoyl-CoA hydratase/isomerase family protein [Alphaproteobacteria bacterium]MBU2083984.1 enoyl-CoA hydratase/isomerase family protein [Alphaproteobacteria bacterium]MBU2142648.1 enoyl-CoA hydratase/isomerase family protein [Alphaproteobacteria bacterium]MBU2196261.1 enoyl-CoA hydratase/isomerase family protein [Alphaproteobacteria bacterium]
MSGYTISVESEIAHLRMNRPEAYNALRADFWNSLPDTIAELDKRADIRCLVLSAEGKGFCAGMDLSVFSGGMLEPNSPAAREAFYYLARSLQRTFSCLEEARFPVIGVIQGPCIGAGLELAAACDLRIAASDAYFRIEEINTGIMADVGALQRMPKILPDPVVREMAFLGTKLSAGRARELGFVMSVLDTPELALNAAMEVARSISDKAPVALSGSKAALNWARDHSVADALEWSARTQSALWSTADISAAITARETKSPADYERLLDIKMIGET